MTNIGVFPFGKPVQILIQENRTPKKVFVLGVYASAVHARWIDSNGKEVVKALAVASEPRIFWRGEIDEAQHTINEIDIPQELGNLIPAAPQFNGASGRTLDDFILFKLGLNRDDAWLCDLVPHSCVNPRQAEAIRERYCPFIQEHHLPLPTVPIVPKKWTNEKRVNEILAELKDSKAEVLILLGDPPIRWFLYHFNPQWKRLSDFGEDAKTYGGIYPIRIAGRDLQVLPLTHPRQIARLGKSSNKWTELHENWMNERATELREKIK